MATRKTGNAQLDELVAQLRKLGKHQYAQVVAAVSDSRTGKTARQAVAEIVNDDLQANLMETGWVLACPECESHSCVKNGKRNGIQRYRCQDCGHRFTPISGTLLEKSGYMWDVWFKITHDLVNCIGMKRTLKSLRDDYGCEKLNHKTLWRMRMKVLYGIFAIPSPTLRGTIQMDDTFFREGQKGTRELKNPLPKTANVERKPRYGVRPSLLGTLGPEFASATCAVDNTGHCVIRSLSMGVPTERQVREFIGEHMEDIAFLATDDDTTYRKAIRTLSLPHYICPSTLLSDLTDEGHTQLSSDPDRAAEESESNRRIKERMWKNGELDIIEGIDVRTYKQRCQLVETYGLTLGRVNSLHGRLDDFIRHNRKGVSTIYLPLYLKLFEYLENRKAEGKDFASMADAADILADAVATHAIFNGEVAREWADGKHAPEMASGVFVAKLMDDTSAVRIATGNNNFKFNKSDGFRYISSRDLLYSLPTTTIKAMVEDSNEGKKRSDRFTITGKSKRQMIRALMELEEVNDLIMKYAYKDAATRIDEEDEELAASAVYAGMEPGTTENRPVLSQTMPRMMFAKPDEVAHPAVFITVKTTGTDYENDEVIGFTAIDENGEILMDRIFKPLTKTTWYEKGDTNPKHIRPSDVFGNEEVDPISASATEIEEVLSRAASVIGWNLHFQLDMLHACHVNVPVRRKFIDLSEELYTDARKRNKNRRNAFDKKAQSKFRESIYHELGEYYQATKPLDDVMYLMRIWKNEFPGFSTDDDVPF